MSNTDYQGHDGYQPETWQQTPPTPERHSVSVRSKIALAIASLAVGIGGGAYWAGVTPGTSKRVTNTAASAEVQLESTSSAGANPFMTPVGEDQVGVTPPAGASGQFTGDTEGLYAQPGDQRSCDAQSLVTNLRADPTKANAWAEAVDIAAADIPGYVASLTPVVLRADTAVTSYGYRNGTFTPYPAVLQAGTSAFINGHGEPRVKCFSGNPLAEAQSSQQAVYVGSTWAGFAPTTVTYVRPATVVINKYRVVDVHNHGRWYDRPGKPYWPGDHGGYCKKHPESPKCPDKGGEGGNKPNPALEKAAAEARGKADQAGTLAKEARAKADDKATEARIFDTEAKDLEANATAKAAEAAADPTNAAKQAAAKQAADKAKAAREAANEKANQAKYSESAAKSAEGTRDAAEAEAKKAQEAADKAAGRNEDGKGGEEDKPADGKDGKPENTEDAGAKKTDADPDKAAPDAGEPDQLVANDEPAQPDLTGKAKQDETGKPGLEQQKLNLDDGKVTGPLPEVTDTEAAKKATEPAAKKEAATTTVPSQTSGTMPVERGSVPQPRPSLPQIGQAPVVQGQTKLPGQVAPKPNTVPVPSTGRAGPGTTQSSNGN